VATTSLFFTPSRSSGIFHWFPSLCQYSQSLSSLIILQSSNRTVSQPTEAYSWRQVRSWRSNGSTENIYRYFRSGQPKFEPSEANYCKITYLVLKCRLSHVRLNPPTNTRRLWVALWPTNLRIVLPLLLPHALVASSTLSGALYSRYPNLIIVTCRLVYRCLIYRLPDTSVKFILTELIGRKKIIYVGLNQFCKPPLSIHLTFQIINEDLL
jgi:hypothetical protein